MSNQEIIEEVKRIIELQKKGVKEAFDDCDELAQEAYTHAQSLFESLLKKITTK